jgi:hypothetical protein
MKIKAAFGKAIEAPIDELRAALDTAYADKERHDKAVIEGNFADQHGKPSSKRTKTPKPISQAAFGKTQEKHWHKVVRVVATGGKGQATRVEIKCLNPGCKNTREIAVQDLFQVSTCSKVCKKALVKANADPKVIPIRSMPVVRAATERREGGHKV